MALDAHHRASPYNNDVDAVMNGKHYTIELLIQQTLWGWLKNFQVKCTTMKIGLSTGVRVSHSKSRAKTGRTTSAIAKDKLEVVLHETVTRTADQEEQRDIMA